ncbi:MAG: glycosyltransferase [Candidatus Omnitrophota bacterium]
MEKTHEPLVSFVVLCYNHALYIRDCIGSILDQEGSYDFEIVIVDDASTDESAEIIRSYSDPRIRFILHEKNLGHAATVNDAMANTRGAYIARIDADDRYRPYFLKETMKIFNMFPEVGVAYGDASLINKEGEFTCQRCDKVHGGKDFKGNEFVKLLEYNFICSPAVIARRQAWRRALPAPGHLVFHDWYFTVMMARRHEFYYINSVIADYRVHPANLHSKIEKDKSWEASVFSLLNLIYSQVEEEAELEEEKNRQRRRIYSAQYLSLADKYFGAGMGPDARRCYLRAILYRPSYILRMSVIWRLLGTLMGRKNYESVKAMAKGLIGALRTKSRAG